MQSTHHIVIGELSVSSLTLDDALGLSLPLEGAAPCGENLEYDPDFVQMQRAAKGTAEVQYGTTITPAQAPDWQAICVMALQLAQRSRDLRIAVLLARALLQLRGIYGLAMGLSLIAELIATQWDQVHPQLDADDDNDPMFRINTLAALCEPGAMLREVREAGLISSRVFGRISLRDIDIANGEQDASQEKEGLTITVIEGVFRDADGDAIESVHAALNLAAASTLRIEQLLTEKVGAAQALDLSALSSLLRRACDFLIRHLPVIESGLPMAPETEVVAQAVARLPDAIVSRDDVTRLLDNICEYYAKQEPGSPVPLLLQRARKLVHKNFTELLQELAPEGLSQLAQVSGVRSDTQAGS
jgi:type VI secretion system protein ImpA